MDGSGDTQTHSDKEALVASENTLNVYTSLQNTLNEVIADSKTLLGSLTANDSVPQEDLDTLTTIVSDCEKMQAQVEGLITHYTAPPSGDVPLIHGITPAEGDILGGTAVIIDGHNFTGVTKLWFGDTPCIDFSVIGDDTIDATSPKTRIVGPVTVFATNLAGTSAGEGDEVSATFTYVDPSASPVEGGEGEIPAGFRGR